MRRHQRKGQSLVEFALALPILVLLLGGIASFGFLLYAHVTVTNSAREAARAGSLYLGSRFHYNATESNPSDCWSMRRWVENALVEVTRDASECPTNSFNTTIHSFGRLSPTQCSSATTGTDCWWLTLGVETASTPSTGIATFTDIPSGSTVSSQPVIKAGNQLRAEVTYRYNVPFLASMFQANPIVINKTVIMRVQNN